MAFRNAEVSLNDYDIQKFNEKKNTRPAHWHTDPMTGWGHYCNHTNCPWAFHYYKYDLQDYINEKRFSSLNKSQESLNPSK